MGPHMQRLYWLAIVLSMAAHFAGAPGAMPLALGVAGLQTVHALAATRQGSHLSVQVRAVFLALLCIGLLPHLGPLHVLMVVGTGVLLVTDYCLLARLLSLLPWNRHEPISIDLLRRLLSTPPARGPIWARVHGSKPAPRSAPGETGAVADRDARRDLLRRHPGA